MSPYIETIKLLNGTLLNLDYHQMRFERTRSEVLGKRNHPKLDEFIQIPDGLNNGLFKCRVVYGKDIDRIEFEPQQPRLIRSLKMVVSDSISYGYKSSDRSELDALYALRGECDDILIVKNNCITDSYSANVVFWKKDGWFTPDTPLLPGTMRASLLASRDIKTMRISPEDLDRFQKIRLINAFHGLNDGPETPIEAVRY